jgi:tetratricopeptide (TPR) repeat protein
MDQLDKETFSFWVTHPDELLQTDFPVLQQAIEQYPYCQALHTLGAKGASVHQKSHAIEWVRKAAAHAISRNALRKLIDNEFQWSDNLLSRLNDLSSKHVPIPDDYQKESYALFKEKADQNRSFASFSFLNFTKPDFEKPISEPLPDQPELAEIQPALPMVDESALTETTLQTSLELHAPAVLPAMPTVQETDPIRRKELEIIENFIRNEPQISRVRLKPGENAPQEDFSRRTGNSLGGGLVTESFAKILVQQGKLDKAIDIYQKLMVKNPEKNTYFAGKIDELEAQKNK